MTPCKVLKAGVSLRLATAVSKADFCATGWEVKTDLTTQRRLAAQALAEEAIEYGAQRGMSRVSIEERLGLVGNPLGQLLSEYLRGETAPSLRGLVRMEAKVAELVGRHPRLLAVAEFDPAYSRFYHADFDGARGCFAHEYDTNSPLFELRHLARADQVVSSRALMRRMSESDWCFVQIIADGAPLLPRFDPPQRCRKLPEFCRNSDEMLGNLV